MTPAFPTARRQERHEYSRLTGPAWLTMQSLRARRVIRLVRQKLGPFAHREVPADDLA
jgi:hypothetical protein